MNDHPDNAPTWSKLQLFIADHADFGPDSAIQIVGFSGREEIDRFIDALYEEGIIKPPKEDRYA